MIVRWEYKKELADSHAGVSERAVLEAAGRDGWELVAVLAHSDSPPEFYFKRRVSQGDAE